MYTEHHPSPPPPPPPPPPRGEKFTSASPANAHSGNSGKCSLWQVRQMFTSANQENSLSTSCKHCMRTTTGAQEHPGYSADATTPWQTCSGSPVVLDETAPPSGRLSSETVCARTPVASPPKIFCSAKSQTGRGPAGWTRSIPQHAVAADPYGASSTPVLG